MCLSEGMNNEQPLKTPPRWTKSQCPTSQLIDCFMDEDWHSKNGE